MIRQRNRLISGVTQLDLVGGPVAFNGLVSITNLVAYYKFDEASGTTLNCINNSALNGTTNATINQTGKIGTAYTFSGTSTRATVTSDSLNLGSGNFTYSWWEYRTSTANANTVMSRSNTFIFGYDDNGYAIYFMKSGGGYMTNLGAWKPMGTGNGVILNEWIHNVVVRNGTTFSFYRNGVKQTDAISSDTMNQTNGEILYFGYQSTWAYNGKIDECGIWSRALTSDEITALYNSGNGLTY